MTHRCATGRHPDPAHGCYTWHGCRCEGCTDANTEASRAYTATLRRLGRIQPRRTPGHATRARIGWLRDQGATDRWIAEQAGMTASNVGYLRRGRTRGIGEWLILSSTAEAIERVYRAVATGRLHPPGEADAIPDPTDKRVRDRIRQRELRARKRAA